MASALPAIASYAVPALLSILAGRLGAGSEHGRAQQLQKMLMQLLSPESIGSETNKLFDIFRASPMYSALRNTAMTGATSLAAGINARAARAGLGNSGLAAVAQPLAQSSFQGNFMNIDSELFQRALEQAKSSLFAKAGVYERTQTPSPWAGGIGRGIESYLPYLYSMLTKQKLAAPQPGFGGPPYNPPQPRIPQPQW